MRSIHPMQLALLVLIGTAAGTAGADVVERRIDDKGESMRFQDDDLLGGILNERGDVVILRLGPERTLLIRPRVSFVPELTKSAEGF